MKKMTPSNPKTPKADSDFAKMAIVRPKSASMKEATNLLRKRGVAKIANDRKKFF